MKSLIKQQAISYGENKTGVYYSKLRSEIIPMLPAKIGRLIDVGCGDGETSAYLKEKKIADWVCGIESSSAVAAIARARLDEVLETDIEKVDLPYDAESIDLILVLDVLEHLVQPWDVVKKLQKYVKPGGFIVASIPNVRNYSVTIPLLLKGDWQYRESDILDATHLRFFTKKTAIELMTMSGLQLIEIGHTGLRPWSPTWIFNVLTLGIFSGFFEFQYLIKVQKPSHK
jgi:2-polyprenyl-3-methyl-5-hydroxy-6-metoxy-1,4-benzoquinol methylase